MKANRELFDAWTELAAQFDTFKHIIQNDNDNLTENDFTEWLIQYNKHIKHQVDIFEKVVEYIFIQHNINEKMKNQLLTILGELHEPNQN